MRLCRGCGTPLSKRSQKVHCDNRCQAIFRREASIKLWLESGHARIDGHQGHYIRAHLAEAQCGRCAICGRSNTWQDLPLALVLDHIDGNPENNRRENLRLICPKSRNRGNGRSIRRQRYADGKSY